MVSSNLSRYLFFFFSYISPPYLFDKTLLHRKPYKGFCYFIFVTQRNFTLSIKKNKGVVCNLKN